MTHPMAATRKRLDVLLVERGLAPSRERARSLIMAGKVLVERIPVDKAGSKIDPESAIEIRGGDLPYVSRGGLKLEKGLDVFGIDPADQVCLDVGASTGGFTDCLLQRGARRVYAVDVGYGQLAWGLRQDPRVVAIERTNIRNLSNEAVPEKVDLVTIDVSFISLRIVVPVVLAYLKPGGKIIALIKPQFEVGKGKVGKGGVVRNPDHHIQVIDTLTAYFQSLKLQVSSTTPSPILGPKGNKEFVICLSVLG